MFPSLEQKLARYEELESQLKDPAVLSNVEQMLEIQKEMGGLAKVAAAVREYRTLEGDIEAARMMVDEICSNSVGWYDGLGKSGEQYLSKLTELVDKLAQPSGENPGGFEGAWNLRDLKGAWSEMHDFFQNDKSRFNSLVSRLGATEKGGMKARRSHNQVVNYLNRLTYQKELPP